MVVKTERLRCSKICRKMGTEFQNGLTDSSETEDYYCRSRSTSPPDPLARLSDYAPGSSASSWGSEEALFYDSFPNHRAPSSLNMSASYITYESVWHQRYVRLQAELDRYQRQTNQMRNLWKERLTELEVRVVEAESRAENAECKVRSIEEGLQPSRKCTSSPNGLVEPNEAVAVVKLATQIEEQRHLRLQDAKLLEAKAARIKEWVTNKLRDLEVQNQHLHEENQQCKVQLELFKKHIIQLERGKSTESVSVISTPEPLSTTFPSAIVKLQQDMVDEEPVYAQVDRQSKKHNHSGDALTHRRYQSESSTSMVDSIMRTTNSVSDNVHSLVNPTSQTRTKSACLQSELTGDYADICTPNSEKLNRNTNSKPPTPPLHRLPSWESRIYQVACEGLLDSIPSDSDQSFRNTHSVSYAASSGCCEIDFPLYSSVEARPSQSPSNGNSSDDLSDDRGRVHQYAIISSPRVTNSSSDNTDTSISSSSPNKSHKMRSNSLSPFKRSSSLSSSKCALSSSQLHTSFESGISDDYAIPPDAISCGSTGQSTLLNATNTHYQKMTVNEICFEKCGYLNKFDGKLKTFRKRWFQLNPSGMLRYWKSQGDTIRKPRGEIFIDEFSNISRVDGATTFEILTPKKIYYLSAESVSTLEEWLKMLQNIKKVNATKKMPNEENIEPTLQASLTKVKNGHSKQCWCMLIGKLFFYSKSPLEKIPAGQINMREARVEQMEHASDSESDEHDKFTIGIFTRSEAPTYLLLPSKQEMESWLYHLTVVSGSHSTVGTHYEQLIQKLIEMDGDPGNAVWKHSLLLHTKETITSPLTTLSSESIILEALKLFKSCQLFMSVEVESTGIDYHVVLAQNALKQCLSDWHLQSELVCILIKQTSPHITHKVGIQVLSKLRHRSLSSIAVNPLPPTSTVDQCKANPPLFVFIQGWQLLALAVSLFVPKDNKILWYLKCHLRRNSDTKTECGKYAVYCQRALERTIQNGNRKTKPSRTEVLSILLKNPYHHSLPHSIPVHFLNGTYQVVGFDGSSTVREFLNTLTQDIGCRVFVNSGFTLFSDDPIEKDLEHYIDPDTKLCDVISEWETVLREKGSGKFENTKVIQLVYKNRLYFKQSAKEETDREKLLMCYQINDHIVNGRFPLTQELAMELAALMAQIDLGELNGDKGRGSGGSSNSKDVVILQAVDRFYPYRYRDDLSSDALKTVQVDLQNKWSILKGRSSLDCIRIYLNCTRKWHFFGASLFQAKWKRDAVGVGVAAGTTVVWLAASEDSISLLELSSMHIIVSYSYGQLITFGSCQDDFVLIINSSNSLHSEKLLFVMSKPKILELTSIIADYMSALEQVGTPVVRSSMYGMQPDLLKTTPDHQLNGSDSKKYHLDK